MITTLQIIFFLSGILIVFTYGGYVIFTLPFIKKKKSVNLFEFPHITLVVAAFNEEEYVAEKVHNCGQLEYPKERISIIFVTDGSTDKTVSILSQFSQVMVLHLDERNGKTAALNRAMKSVHSEITLFSDANTMLNSNALISIAKHFAQDDVGGVSGEKKIINKEADSAAGSGEGLYWKYESLLKKADSAFYSLTGAPGELIAFRTKLYDPIPSNVILDDFMLSMNICSKGYRMVYEPGAVATETASANIKEELKRKIRICAGGFQAMQMLKETITFNKSPRLYYTYISHRVMRWAVAPWSIIVLFLSNLFLLLNHPFFVFTFIAQCLFYFQTLVGWYFKEKKVQLKGFFVPYYFFIMNYAAIAGYFKYKKGNQSAVWERSKRASG